MDMLRAVAIARIVARAGEDWAFATLAVLALGDAPEPTSAQVGAAMRAARCEILATSNVRAREGAAAMFAAANAPKAAYDRPSDDGYAIRERDIRAAILDRVDAQIRAKVRPEHVDRAIETLWPHVLNYLDFGNGYLARTPAHRARIVQILVDPARKSVLDALGTIPGTKSKIGMRGSPPVPTSGTASPVIVRKGEDVWLDGLDGTRLAITPEAADTLLRLTALRGPVRAGSERDEHSDDRIADFRKPVRKPARKRGSQRAGRLGTSAIVR